MTEDCALSLENDAEGKSEVFLGIDACYEIIDRTPENQDYPSDISESELMEMLTEVMSLMLLNKNDAVVKYTGLDKLPEGAKLPHPNALSKLSKKRRLKKQRRDSLQKQAEGQDEGCEEEKLSGEEKAAFKEKMWEQKHSRHHKKKSFEERLAEYESAQKQAAKQEQSKHMMKLQMYMQDQQH